MITARAAGVGRAPALIAAVGFAAAIRSLVGGAAPAASVPAAIVFGAVLAGAVVWAGGPIAPISWRGPALGVAGAAALVALSVVGLPAITVGPRAAASTLAWWIPLVSLVAATEELVFRGVLFEALQSRSGDLVAVAVTAVLFAAIHAPLYGVGALPVDLFAGVFLGFLRLAAHSVSAPAFAHVLADVATGWVG